MVDSETFQEILLLGLKACRWICLSCLAGHGLFIVGCILCEQIVYRKLSLYEAQQEVAVGLQFISNSWRLFNRYF